MWCHRCANTKVVITTIYKIIRSTQCSPDTYTVLLVNYYLIFFKWVKQNESQEDVEG